MSNKSSFWEHKATGTLGVLLTLGPAASESLVSCVAPKPQVWRQKAGWWPAAAADTLSKQRERAWSVRGRSGWTLRGWFRVAFFFFFCSLVFFLFTLFLFYFNKSIQFCSIQQLSACQNLAEIPTQPFPVQTAPVNFYNPVLKLQAHLLLTQAVWSSILHMCVTPAVASTSPWPLKCQLAPSPI